MTTWRFMIEIEDEMGVSEVPFTGRVFVVDELPYIRGGADEYLNGESAEEVSMEAANAIFAAIRRET